MKYLAIVLVALSLFLGGCSDEMTLYKQDEIAAVQICEKNDGYSFYKLEREFLNMVPEQMVVSCNDGAVFVLQSHSVLTSYQGQNGSTYTRVENTRDYEWKVKK